MVAGVAHHPPDTVSFFARLSLLNHEGLAACGIRALRCIALMTVSRSLRAQRGNQNQIDIEFDERIGYVGVVAKVAADRKGDKHVSGNQNFDRVSGGVRFPNPPPTKRVSFVKVRD